uniref:rust resistance kinase Lr10-like n=1 Tax=Erigeron canadensis TaxID=72917 RepID=UPI001CB88C9E|nr:rust resistance kinase Lr10-like [Erigeron canadensis]
MEIFISNHGNLAPKRFKYSEIKKMTNSFLEKLGQGSYGSVYKGKLPDGELVAVKLLSKGTGEGEDFINEVASIGRTSHVNIVTLIGFCIEGKQRALMYEFMPNGSLDKFLRGDGHHLSWNTLFEITQGIARGLEYLHQGSNTRIVHFDIKPHNILLDEEFVPKISDFGLAKLWKNKESIVSVKGARGTVGYMAPEVFFNNLGGASHKSDVYSFGMMVLEMTGAHKNNTATKGNSSDSYFPDWIYKQIETTGNRGDYGVTNDEEEKLARKMMMISLWCIQYDPSDRPSISKVVEMLEGSFESLVVPPKRFWSSPTTQPPQGSSTSVMQSSSIERASTIQAVGEDFS